MLLPLCMHSSDLSIQHSSFIPLTVKGNIFIIIYSKDVIPTSPTLTVNFDKATVVAEENFEKLLKYQTEGECILIRR